MYKLRYVRSDGRELRLDHANGYDIATISGLTGYNTDISTVQGFGQVGVTVTNTSVKGQPMQIKGYVLDAKTSKKYDLLQMFLPSSKGRLFFADKYYVDVYVKKTPTISQEQHSTFALDLFAPYPFWMLRDEKNAELRKVTPAFSFPINYSVEHSFGTTFYNGADIEVISAVDIDMVMQIYTLDKVFDLTITNIDTGEYLRITGTSGAGGLYHIFKENGVVRVVRYRSDGEAVDMFRRLDSFSNLFALHPGLNRLRITYDATQWDDVKPIVTIAYHEAIAGVLMDGV